VSWRDLDHDDVVAAASQVESDRFGVSLARVTVGRRAVGGDETWRRLTLHCGRPEDVLVVRGRKPATTHCRSERLNVTM